MSELDDSIMRAFEQGAADTLFSFRNGGALNDNKPASHPHSKMVLAEEKFATAKNLAGGVRHLRKCAKELNHPGWFTHHGAQQTLEDCDHLLAAIKAGESADRIVRLSLILGATWGQLKTRASV